MIRPLYRKSRWITSFVPLKDHSNDGEVLMQGHLVNQGIKVPPQKLQNAPHHDDHSHIVACWNSVIHRRVYYVPHLAL